MKAKASFARWLQTGICLASAGIQMQYDIGPPAPEHGTKRKGGKRTTYVRLCLLSALNRPICGEAAIPRCIVSNDGKRVPFNKLSSRIRTISTGGTKDSRFGV